MASGIFDIETDVVVIGYGGAGGTAAITAHDNGAEVIILEKMPQFGGNTRVAGGNMALPKEPKKFAQYLNTLCFGITEPEIIDTFAQGVMENKGWLKSVKLE